MYTDQSVVSSEIINEFDHGNDTTIILQEASTCYVFGPPGQGMQPSITASQVSTNIATDGSMPTASSSSHALPVPTAPEWPSPWFREFHRRAQAMGGNFLRAIFSGNSTPGEPNEQPKFTIMASPRGQLTSASLISFIL